MNGIQIQNLTKSFGDPAVTILDKINLEISKGDFVSITGKSGSGKSTLLYSVSGLDKFQQGKVLFDGVDVTNLDPKELSQFRNTKIGFVFQFHYLLPELTALENILMPCRKFDTVEKYTPKAKQLLAQFGLSDCADKLPSQMSGGQNQRVAIARSLIADPEYLFADEPTGNLDSHNGEIVMKIFEQTHKELGTTILMVTHDEDFAKRAKRRVHLLDGRVVKN